MYNKDFLDALQMVSFIVGIMNYNENLTQNDKDDIIRYLDQQTTDILAEVRQSLNQQNRLLNEILSRLK